MMMNDRCSPSLLHVGDCRRRCLRCPSPRKTALCTLVLLLFLRQAGAAEVPPPEVIAQLRAFDPHKGDIATLIRTVVPKLAPVYLKLGTMEVHKGGPLSETLGPGLPAKLDASPGSLPIVVYKKEAGRLPAAFIIARYKNVQPTMMLSRLATREAAVRHPLVAQYTELSPLTAAEPGPWGEGVMHKVSSGFTAVNMPFGAGLFGLLYSYVFGDWDIVYFPNGVALMSYTDRAPLPDELQKLMKFKDKKGKERTLEEDYHRVREYRLTSLLIPERDATGQLKHTVHVYFVRIVPALKPSQTLQDNGALARWIFDRGAQEALVTPVKLIRDEVDKANRGK